MQLYWPNPNRICIYSATNMFDNFQHNKENGIVNDRLEAALETFAVQSEKATYIFK